MDTHQNVQSTESPLQLGLKLVRQCPLCQFGYNTDALSILEQKEGTNLLHITCPSCLHAVLVVVMVSPMGMSSIGVLTDLSRQDMTLLKQRLPINEDEVLDFHTYLSKDYYLFERQLLASRLGAK